MKSKKPDELAERVARLVIESALPHLPGWIETLGRAGAPKKKGERDNIAPATRVKAAKTGVDFVTKFIGEAGEGAIGSTLLKELDRLDRRYSQPERAEGDDWPEDAELEGEEADME